MDRTVALDLLSNVSIASPCEVSWESMKGDNRVRFCGECHLNVYNLSNMKAVDAAALVQQTEGRLCIKFYQRDDGTMLTTDCPKGLRPRIRWAAGRIAAAVAAAFGIIIGTSGCMGMRICPPVKTGDSGPKPGQMRPLQGTPTASSMPTTDPPEGQLRNLN